MRFARLTRRDFLTYTGTGIAATLPLLALSMPTAVSAAAQTPPQPKATSPGFTYLYELPGVEPQQTPQIATSTANMFDWGDGTYTIWTDPQNDHLLFSQLVNFKLDGTLVPNLAMSWSASPDATRYHFDLNPAATWHDGVAFTAADVEFTFMAALRKDT